MNNRSANLPTMAAALLLSGVSFLTASAQTPPAGPPPGPPPPQNLLFYPKEMTRQEVVGKMRAITTALGARCDLCHVDEDDGPNPRHD